MNTFQVLGITLTDHSVREAMRLADTYLEDGAVSTICYITAGGLLEAENRPETKEFLENMNLTVPADTEVLKAAGIQSRARLREVAGGDFLKQFLHKISAKGKKVVLLSDSQENLAKLKKGLLSFQANLRLTGGFALEDAGSDADSLINDLNVLEPDILISNLEYPAREEFFSEHHMKLHTQIWLLLKQDMVIENRNPSLLEKIRASLARKALRRSVDQYKKEEDVAKKLESSGSQEGDDELLKMETQKIDAQMVERVIGEGTKRDEGQEE